MKLNCECPHSLGLSSSLLAGVMIALTLDLQPMGFIFTYLYGRCILRRV
jgi:hypothetical protein